MELPPGCKDTCVVHVGHARYADVPGICADSDHLCMRSIRVSCVHCMCFNRLSMIEITPRQIIPGRVRLHQIFISTLETSISDEHTSKRAES